MIFVIFRCVPCWLLRFSVDLPFSFCWPAYFLERAQPGLEEAPLLEWNPRASGHNFAFHGQV